MVFDWQSELSSSIAVVSPPKTIVQPPTSHQKRSFAQIRAPAVTDSAPLPLPTIRGDNLSIKIIEDVYNSGLEKCKHHIHGDYF